MLSISRIFSRKYRQVRIQKINWNDSLYIMFRTNIDCLIYLVRLYRSGRMRYLSSANLISHPNSTRRSTFVVHNPKWSKHLHPLWRLRRIELPMANVLYALAANLLFPSPSGVKIRLQDWNWRAGGSMNIPEHQHWSQPGNPNAAKRSSEMPGNRVKAQ